MFSKEDKTNLVLQPNVFIIIIGTLKLCLNSHSAIGYAILPVTTRCHLGLLNKHLQQNGLLSVVFYQCNTILIAFDRVLLQERANGQEYACVLKTYAELNMRQ